LGGYLVHQTIHQIRNQLLKLMMSRLKRKRKKKKTQMILKKARMINGIGQNMAQLDLLPGLKSVLMGCQNILGRIHQALSA
jgi:hypothetical protein